MYSPILAILPFSLYYWYHWLSRFSEIMRLTYNFSSEIFMANELVEGCYFDHENVVLKQLQRDLH